MVLAARRLEDRPVDETQSIRKHLHAITAALMTSGLICNACQCEDGLDVLKASVVLEPEQLDFEQVPLDSTKLLSLKIWNKGSFVLNVSEFRTDTPFIPPTLSATIGIGQHREIVVGFKPSSLGAISGNLSFKTSDPDAPTVIVPLKGVGIQAAITVDPELVDFGDVLWKSKSPDAEIRTIKISNPGSDSFDLTSLTLTDDGQGVFSLDPMTAQTNYAPEHEEEISISFAPQSKGMHSGTLEILNTTPSRPSIVVPLMGKAVGPILNLCARVDGGAELCSQSGDIPRVDLGFVDPNATGHGRVRVVNEGDRDLNIDQTLISGTGSQAFFTFSPTVVEDEQIQLSPGQEKSWNVTFVPDNYQPGIIFMSFTTNASNNDASMVSGANSVRIDAKVGKPTIQVKPERVTFSHVGAIDRGETKIRIFSCGTFDLVLADISIRNISGPAQAFTLENIPSNGTTIAPQTNCEDGSAVAMQEFEVVFAASIPGTYRAEAMINSNDPNKPTVTIEISGNKS
jgi:hypothetical protein